MVKIKGEQLTLYANSHRATRSQGIGHKTKAVSQGHKSQRATKGHKAKPASHIYKAFIRPQKSFTEDAIL